ncbi:MAG: hypothetical protein ABIJ56_22960 [Pseudomonadota bacterium]
MTAIGFFFAASLTFLLFFPRMVFSEPSTSKAEGVVVKVAGNEVIIDIGAKAGAAAGMSVDFMRKILVKHPVTGKKIEDRFFIGKDKIRQAGKFLSLVVIETDFTHRPVVGDFAVLSLPVIVPLEKDEPKKKKKAVEAEPEPEPCPEVDCPESQCDYEALKVNEVWLATLGKSVDDRISIWKHYLQKYPTTPYVKEILQQIASLKDLKKVEFEAGVKLDADSLKIYHDRVDKTYEGLPLDIAVEISEPESVAKMILHYRMEGGKFYSRAGMERSGDFNYHTSIPPEMISGKGIEYFIVVVGKDGKKRIGVGSARSPEKTAVRKSPVKQFGIKDKSQWTTSFEYVDFYYKDVNRDYFWKLESDFLYKIRTFLYSVRMGLGFFQGQGGRLEDIENKSIPDSALDPLSFAYFYTEMELRIVKYFYVSGRFLAGTTLQKQGHGNGGDVIVGGQGRVRIGEDWAYLVLAASFTKDAGIEAELSVTIDVLKKIPIAGYVLVTDLPVSEEWGVRLVGQVGWRPAPWIAISLRAGWNIRTITHESFSVGAVTELKW